MDLVKQIVRELIPEKFSFLFPVPHFFRSDPMAKMIKEEKSPHEELLQKSPSTKSQSLAKGEAATLQKGEVPEEIEPVEKSFSSNLLQRDSPPLSAKGEITPPMMKEGMAMSPQFLPPSFKEGLANFQNQLMAAGQQIKPEAFSLPHNHSVPQFLQKNMAELSRQPSSIQPIGVSGQNNQMAGTGKVVLPMMHPQAALPGEQGKAGKGNVPLSPIGEIADSKQIRPRKDVIPGVDRHENPVAHRKRGDEDGNIVRFPILPDFPLSREGILKEKGGKKGVLLLKMKGLDYQI